jgi:hypothetical protein
MSMPFYLFLINSSLSTVELGYNVMKGTEYFVSLQTSFIVIEEYNFMVKREELIPIIEILTLWTRCRIS